MTKSRKEFLLTIFILILVLLFNKNTKKELEFLNKELDRIIIEVDVMKKELQRPSLPTNGFKTSFHKGGYENAWIQYVNQKTGLVLVTTIDSKLNIVFKPTPDNLNKFHIGWIAPVTFSCVKTKKGDCDFNSPYNLFVSNAPVVVKRWVFIQERQYQKNAVIHHGPGDNGFFNDVLIMYVKNGTSSFFIQSKLINLKDKNKIAKIKKDNNVKVIFPEDNPHTISVNGAEMTIVAIKF